MSASSLTIIDRQLLDGVTAQAMQSPRLRKNHNFHPSDEFISHRLLNAMEPGSYIRPHRHLDSRKDESIVILRGRIGIVSFDEEGRVTLAKVLAPCGEAIAVDIPHGLFHTLVSLESGSVFFEAKAGPYLPLTEAEKAPWAPDEGNGEAVAYLERISSLFGQG